MKRTIAMVLALMMVLALVPVVGMNTALAAAPGASISVNHYPSKLFYVPGSTLDLTGLKLNVSKHYSNGNAVDGSAATLDYTDASLTYKLNDKDFAHGSTMSAEDYKAGDYTLKVIYTSTVTEDGTSHKVEASVNVTIRIRSELLMSIVPNSQPNKTEYFVGEKLDLSGLSFALVYSSKTNGTATRTDTSKALSEFTLKDGNDTLITLGEGTMPTLETAGDYTVIASYKDPTEERTLTSSAVKVTVKPSPAAESLEVKRGGVVIADSKATPASVTQVFDEAVIGTANGSVSLGVGLTVDGKAETNASYVSWGSSKPEVATVNTKGELKILAVGEATITVRTRGDNQQSASFKVTVTKTGPALTDVSLNKTTLTLTNGSMDKLTATLVPTDAIYNEATGNAPTWTSDKSGVVKVTADPSNPFAATVEAVGPGSATITFTAKDTASTPASYTAKCVITVNNIPVDQVYITPTAVTLLEGASYPIQGTVLPYDATDQTLTWTSSNNALATVKDGRVTVSKIADWTALKNPTTGVAWTTAQVNAGSCYTTVTITCASASNPQAPTATCTVTIKQGTLVTQLSLNKYAASLAIGGSTQVVATVLPTNATTKTVTWRSSDPTIATVSSTGKITGVKAGTCDVIATSNGSGTADLSKTCKVTVSAVQSGSIGLSALDLTLFKQQTATLVATIIPSNTTNKDVTFTSSRPEIASVDAKTGLITALSNGKTTITVTSNDGSKASASCLVTVKDQVAVKKITLNMSDFSLLYGDTTTLSATVEPDYASDTDVTWASSNPNAVSVDENGKVSGLTAGQSAVITATAKDGSGVYGSVVVDVVSSFLGNGKVVNCLRRVNVRATPSGQGKFKGYAYLNSTYKVLGKTGNWYKIRYNSESCYIWSAYIRLVGDGTADYTSSGKATTTVTPTTGTGTGTATGTITTCKVTNCVYAVNVRSGPGTNYDKIGIAALNTTYKYLGTYGDWYKLQFNATTEGYIHSNYIAAS